MDFFNAWNDENALPLGVRVVQVRRGPSGEVCDPPSGAVPRVHGPTSEDYLQEGAGWTADSGQRGGRTPACQALRRTGSFPQLPQARLGSLQGRRGLRGLEIPPRQRSLARARRLAIHRRVRNGNFL